jgi:uncharacterized membrane protein
MSTPLHPAIVHLPLGVALVLPLVALALTVAMWRGRLPTGIWGLVVGLQVLVVGGAGFAMRTGEQEEDRVEHVVAKKLIHEHEEKAEAFMGSAWAVLFLSAGVLFVRRKPGLVRALSAATTVGAVAMAGLGMNAGKAGGELVYVHGAAKAYQEEHQTPPPTAPGGLPVAEDHAD